MAQQIVLMTFVALTVLGSFCKAGGSHHKHIIIHVPYHIKHHHHTHTIYKHIKHIDHGHDHHHHHHEEIHIPSGWDLGGWSSGGNGWSGSGGDNGWASSGGNDNGWPSGSDGGFDSGSYENNNFGSLGWDDK